MFAADFIEPRCSFVQTCDSSVDISSFRAELDRAGVFVGEIEGGAFVSDESLFESIALAFRFPGYFGNNWDALLDCLRDLEWLSAIGYVVVVHDASAAFRRTPETMARFVEACGDVASFWMENERPFHLVLLMPDGKTRE